ncbi:hypothetical protein [Xylanimonas sp. McL0601]|uniref:hypothetical protein n=1 Tax=Xylanimonas sp. McL0601 TaxID=3414739 RepID=UPI003CF3E5E7
MPSSRPAPSCSLRAAAVQSSTSGRATVSGKLVFGVEDADGEVTYFTEKALRLAPS